MSEGAVREKSFVEELEALKECLDVSHAERILKKYWNEVERHRAEIDRVREETYREVKTLKAGNEEKDILISILVSHIKDKGLL